MFSFTVCAGFLCRNNLGYSSPNVLFIGPPGSGKTMLSSRIPTVLPPLSFDEALEVTKVYSVAGKLPPEQPLVVTRPFRSPHHTISDAGLIGGGHYPRPGELSLAHRGVLFLDELPEFKKHVLEVLRQPLEEGRVTISRAAVSLEYPGDVMLVAAMNPCPCGYLGDDKHHCSCTPIQIQRYRSRLSGPLLDRIDLHVEVPAVPYRDLKQEQGSISSAVMQERIDAARKVQRERYVGLHFSSNSELSGKWLERFCPLTAKEHDFLEGAVQRLGMSARAFVRVLRISPAPSPTWPETTRSRSPIWPKPSIIGVWTARAGTDRPGPVERFHSWRSASMGLSPAARRAGK